MSFFANLASTQNPLNCPKWVNSLDSDFSIKKQGNLQEMSGPQHSPPSQLQSALLVSSLQKPLPTNATLSQSGTKKENGFIHGTIKDISSNKKNTKYFGQQPGHENNYLPNNIFFSVGNLLPDILNMKFK